MSGLQFDNKISLGHIISIGLIIFGGITAYADLRATQTQFNKEMARFAVGAENREHRMRAVETAQAGQSTDLRSARRSVHGVYRNPRR